MVGVLLTNRVHPTRDTVAIRKARPAAYDAIVEALTTSFSGPSAQGC
jgi:serine-type D-Ala-D-Ala carboxypeptidase